MQGFVLDAKLKLNKNEKPLCVYFVFPYAEYTHLLIILRPFSTE